jgi:uncharacterized protein (TIGR04255 family)
MDRRLLRPRIRAESLPGAAASTLSAMSPKPKASRAASDADLPEFERPPVAEVVLGIQFDPIVNLGAAHLGTIWGLFRAEFPRTEDRPPIAPVFEQFGDPPGPRGMEWNLDLDARPLIPRCWFTNATGSELLQVQSDRFHHNWRRTEQEHEYPRYAKLRARFEQETTQLQALLANDALGELVPNQCEVTYINHITAGEVWKDHSEAGKVFRLLVDGSRVPLSAQPEHVRFDTAFPMRDDAGQFRGRLHVSVASGFLREPRDPMFAMTLTARGAPLGGGLAGALEFLDLGHRWIVRGFAELTTEAMHAVWGKRSR